MTSENISNIEIVGKGRVSVKRGGKEEILNEDAAPRKKQEVEKKKKVPTRDLQALHSLVNQAFPGEGLGMGQAEYFVPIEKGSQDEIISACARLARASWSSQRVAAHIVNRNIEAIVSLSLGVINQDAVLNNINILSEFISQFYPGNQTQGRRQKVLY